nr:hypothetical protein [Treponema sp.]
MRMNIFSRNYGVSFSVIVLLSLLIFNTACKVGLGETVDTEAPIVKIENPESSKVIHGDLEISGSWSDDKGIKSVVITKIEEISGSEPVTKAENIAATINSDGSW